MQPIEEKERFTLSKIVSDNLREYILSNKLITGDKLPSERELAKMLDVSRVIIREALRSLESTGIITIRHGGGAYVNTDDSSVVFNNLLLFWQMKDKTNQELFELRLLLEKAAIEHIIEISDPKQLNKLDDQIKVMNETDNLDSFKEYDMNFHRGLISATNNKLFIQLADIIVQYFANVSPSPSKMTEFVKMQTIQEHQLLVNALREKDKETALKILDQHLHRSLEVRNAHDN